MTGAAAGSPSPTHVPFWKTSGSGNDFVVVDNRAALIPPDAAPAFARAVCRRRVSVGADGLVLLDRPDPAGPPAHVRWRYLNADGSDGDLCGNGAMCGARVAHLLGLAPAACVLQTPAGPVRAEVAEDPADPRVRLAIADPGPVRALPDLPVLGRAVTLHALSVGVPHAFLVADDLEAVGAPAGFLAFGRAVRRHPAFAPAGTNLDAIKPHGGDTLRMRTYERGVEDETLACGTGAVASAVVATALGLVTPPVTVLTRGGLPLVVDFAPGGDHATGVTVQGEARVVATGEVWAEALR